ncbi:MAG: hypothetical protein U9Q62_00855 [Campylobacterota bacterium]|nr:hypothetical protein [Campylobacterota bacterium]
MRFILLFLPILLFAEMLGVGDRVTPLSVKDQFEKSYKIGSELCWVITWDQATTRHANNYFGKDPSLLDQNLTRMIVDVSQTPSGIMRLFVLPKMRSYGHPILLSYDEAYNFKLPYREDHITILSLDNGVIDSIDFAPDERALSDLLEDH